MDRRSSMDTCEWDGRSLSADSPQTDDQHTDDSEPLSGPIGKWTRQERSLSVRSYTPKHFFLPSQTIIVFDLDDTLFPTTWMVDYLRIGHRKEPVGRHDMKLLSRCARYAVEVLKIAWNQAERVSIVTLASPEWLESTVKSFAPEVYEVLNQLSIRVIYARDFIPSKHAPPQTSPLGSRFAQAKMEAIGRECEAFYCKYQ